MLRGAKSSMADGVQTRESESREESVGRRSVLSSIIPEALLLAVAVLFFVVALDFEYVQRSGRLGPAFWPQVICVGIFACSLATMLQKIRSHGRPTVQHAPIEIKGMAEIEEGYPVLEDDQPVQWSRLVTAIALAIAYPIGAIFLGYLIATAIFLIIFMYLGNRRKWYVLPTGILGSLLFTYVFGKVVYISVPTGVGVFDRLSVAVYQSLGIY